MEIGDYIGIYFTNGSIESSYEGSGGLGMWYNAGDKIPANNIYFLYIDEQNASLYGMG